jgi:endonuclease YncB( thermonuclease family)
MRKSDLLLGFLALAALGGGALFSRPAPLPPIIAVSLQVPAEPAPAAAPPPAAPALPTVAVGERPVHTIDDDKVLPVPAISLRERDGRAIALRTPPAAPPPPPAPVQASTLGGAAQALGGARLKVEGRSVDLFGVQTPPDGRCAVSDQAALPCGDAARAALAARLKPNAKVTCRMPPGQHGDPAFVCRDASGLDLGGFLVAEGYALADTNRSYDYLGAQDVARSFHRGLWRYR